MNTPICDFVEKYINDDKIRLHMPGHKGKNFLGIEKYDITEIDGADNLFEADGIIYESEKNAGFLFGASTFYSTEGSSLCIRAMLYLILLSAKEKGEKPVIAAGRNAHKTFLSAAALLDFDISWLYPKDGESYFSGIIDAKTLEAALLSSEKKPTAVYLTSPDYLGNITDIKSISEVCHRHGVLLAVDNAHGAYLKFLKNSMHPIDLGADICCDSAHKTLPVLTGGAYLHISHNAPDIFVKNAKTALSLFASTSPSYLILQSLDAANLYLSENYAERLKQFLNEIYCLKKSLKNMGFCFVGAEPLKLTIDAKAYGFTGTQLAAEMAKRNLVCEFFDPDFVVMMLTLETGKNGLERIQTAMSEIPKRPPLFEKAPKFNVPKQALSVRDAVFSLCEELPAKECVGRICARSNVSCPPAVPIVVCGETISAQIVKSFEYYGINKCYVVKEI